MTKLTKTLATAGVALALLAAGSGLAIAETVTLRYSNWVPATHPINTKVMEPFIEELAERTDGRVQIEMIPALGPPQGHFDLVANGVADMAFGVHSYTPGRFRLTEIGELPLTHNNTLVNSLAYWNTYTKMLMEAGEHDGVRLLGLWTNPPYHLAMKDVLLTDLDAVEGKRIRVPGTITEQVARTLGMVPISSTITDAYEQVSRGIISGMFQAYETIYSFNLAEHLTHVTVIPGGFAHSSQFLMINPDAYMRMSEEDRAIFDEMTGEALVRRFAEMWDSEEQAGYEKLTEMGTVTHHVSDELAAEIAEKLQFIRDDWVETANARGVDGAAALAFYEAEIDRLAEELGAGN